MGQVFDFIGNVGWVPDFLGNMALNPYFLAIVVFPRAIPFSLGNQA